MTKKKKYIYYGFPFVHHKDTKGGYHHIKDYISYDIIFNLQAEKYFFDITLEKNILLKIIKKIYFLIFKKIGFLQLIKCSYLSIIKRNLVFHFIYPENTYAWIHKIKNSSNKVICTFHQPTSYYENSAKWINIIKNLDAIIILNKSDLFFYKAISKRNNVYFIPHGINTNFFKIDKEVKKENRILMVGNWLRNFDLAKILFKKINLHQPDIIIDLVINNENKIHFNNLNINFHSKISDIELKLLYQKSKIVFFPLIDFTANNAMLEAMSCGTNILVATDKVIRESDQLTKFLTIVPNDENVVYNKIIELMFTPEKDNMYYLEMHNYCKNNYAWEIVSEKTKILISNLL